MAVGLAGWLAVGPSVRKLVSQTCAICNAAERTNQPRQRGMSCLNPEVERRLSRQVSTDQAEKAGIWTRVGGIMMMMYMAWPAEQGRRRINLTPEASRSMDGWMGREGNTGLNKRPPEKSSAARILAPFTIPTPEGLRIWTPPSPWSTEYKVQPPIKAYYVQDKRAHSHTRTQSHNPAGVRPTCNQRTGPVQRHTRPILCCSIDCRCKIHVNKRQWVVPRIFVSGACTCTGLVLADR